MVTIRLAAQEIEPRTFSFQQQKWNRAS